MSDGRQAKRRSVHHQIADDLRAAIRSGEYQDGDRLPGENALMQRYGVARATAREALAVLRNEGLAVARRGSGVYVRLFAPIRRHGSERLSRERWGTGRDVWASDVQERRPQVDPILVTRTAVPPEIASLLDVEPGSTVVLRDRRYVVDGRPVQLARSYVPLDLAVGTRIEERDTGPGGVYARLDEMGHGPEHFRETLRARMPSPEELNALDLPAGTPVIEIVRTALDATGRAVEVNVMILDSSCYVLDYDVHA